MKLAIIGSGISGLTAAYLLRKKYDITVYESDDRVGGHTATKIIETEHGAYNIDTGFIVYNDWTYPNFIKLMSLLGVQNQPTAMGFSAFYADGHFEYSGDSINTLFSDRRTIFSAAHWQMLRDIVRFNREAVKDWHDGAIQPGTTLGEYLHTHGYSRAFCERYLIPMGSAIWSASTRNMYDFPLQFFVQFFHNHGLLSINDRPTWRVLRGGSSSYLAPLTQSFKDRIRIAEPVVQVRRDSRGACVVSSRGEEHFDQVIFACHSDQALRLLADATEQERTVLGAIAYRDNDVVLHTDETLLPKRRRTWSSWNYRLNNEADQPPVLTYNMNILQGLKSPQTFCVTLNATSSIAPEKILGRYSYAHPVFTLDAIKAQNLWHTISGVHKTWFCGAYWFNGFHEDGVKSAVRVATGLGVEWK